MGRVKEFLFFFLSKSLDAFVQVWLKFIAHALVSWNVLLFMLLCIPF